VLADMARRRCSLDAPDESFFFFFFQFAILFMLFLGFLNFKSLEPFALASVRLVFPTRLEAFSGLFPPRPLFGFL